MIKKIVLQKFIADSGYCSRRKAEDLIRNGFVDVNNEKAELGMKVGLDDKVQVNNKFIKLNNKKIYIKLNKPKGYTCTNRKFDNEKNIFDLVKIKERLFSVGRLDKNSRGLVLLTNDGELTQKLTHPKFKHEKKYIVKIKCEKLDAKKIIKNFKEGVDIYDGDGIVRAKEIKYLENNQFEIILTEGKKRQIRRMFDICDCSILDLKRIKIGNFDLGEIKEGEWEELSKNEIKLI